MKNLFMILVVTGVIFLLTGDAKADLNKHGGGYFYTTLSSHGQWMDLGDGMVVWKPYHVRRGWAPYSVGEWVWTDDGWYWDSYEPFGDIVYHYGRWYFDDYYGWIWVPDNQWAPAWVEWRYDNDYIGWAPLSPYADFSISVGIHFTHNYYSPYTHWNFVSYRNFCSPNMYNYYVGPKVKYRIYNNTEYRTNYEYRGGNVYNRGIDRDFVQKRGNGNVRTRQIERVSDPSLFGDRSKDRERNVVRTYVASNDDISRENLGNVNIKRSERNTSLDLTKVNIGRSERQSNSGNNRIGDRNGNERTDPKRDRKVYQEESKTGSNSNTRNGRESIISRDGDPRRMDSPPVTERKRDTDVRQQQELQKRQQGELQKKQQQELQKRQQGELQKQQQQELQRNQQRQNEQRQNRQSVQEKRRNDAPVVRDRQNTRTEERKVEQRKVEQRNDRGNVSKETRKDSGNRRR